MEMANSEETNDQCVTALLPGLKSNGKSKNVVVLSSQFSRVLVTGSLQQWLWS